jgi:hypothetical protein
MFASKKYHGCSGSCGRYVEADLSTFVASTLEKNERITNELQAEKFQPELPEVDLPSTGQLKSEFELTGMSERH